MMPIAPHDTSFVAQLTIVTVGIGLAWLLHRRALLSRGGKTLVALSIGTVVISHVAWAVGRANLRVSAWGVEVAMTTLPIVSLFVLSLLPSAALRTIVDRLWRRAPTREPASSILLSRRNVLAAVTSVAPAAALGVGVSGFRSGASAPMVPLIRMPYEGLPAALSGLRILQLSDLHLGCSRGVEDVERTLDRVGRVDLVVFTGDVAEDVSLLTPVLRAALASRPRYGVFACLGNHEYLRGIEQTRPQYERSGVDLLVDDARVVRVGGGSLSLIGVDDPISIHAPVEEFFARRLDRALAHSRDADLRVLLAHRPEAFPLAANRHVDLVLSGHTHGGQIGFNGKSAFQPIWPQRYLWGAASRGRARLYTTSGFGQWYPFRLGCPSEAPLIELVGAPRSDA